MRTLLIAAAAALLTSSAYAQECSTFEEANTFLSEGFGEVMLVRLDLPTGYVYVYLNADSGTWTVFSEVEGCVQPGLDGIGYSFTPAPQGNPT